MAYPHDGGNPYQNQPPYNPQQYPPPYAPVPPPQDKPAKPEPKAKEVVLGCAIMLGGLVVLGGCLGAMAGNSGDSDDASGEVETAQPSEEPSETEAAVEEADEGELDEWTEMIFELTWADMSPAEQDELCVEVQHYGADAAAEIIADETSEESEIDRDTVESILTDYCL